MYRQSPSRNQRSKRIKVKHVLQICLLLAVCFWLIYQVKHSHDKKKEFDETDAKAALHRGSSDGFLKLGRKDVHPRLEEIMTKNEKHDEEEEEETTGEEDEENKHEEEGPEDKEIEEKEDEGMGDGDDETDEHGLEKLDTEVDQVEDFIDDEKDREDSVEKETEGKDFDDDGQMEKESSKEDADHDGDDRSTHEAREELYKADDASSAVLHDTQIETTVNKNEHVGNSNERPEYILEQENKENNSEEADKGEIRKELEVHGGEIAKDDNQSNVTNGKTNVTTSETKEHTLDNSETSSSPSNTMTQVSNDNLKASNGSTEVTTRNHDVSLQNAADRTPKLDHGPRIVTEGTYTEGSDLQTIALEQANKSTLDVENNPLESNSTGNAETKVAESNSEDFFNPSNDTDSSALRKVTRSEASIEAGNNTKSATEKNDETEAEKSDISNGTDEVLDSAMPENPEEIQKDSVDLSDSSNSLEEKDVRTDLDTLPEIQTEGTNSEDVAE